MAAIEKVREYWNRRPCNIRHSPRSLGSREYFDEVEARKYFVEPHIPTFAQFERWRGKKVLEIGCGIGTDSINFARAGAALTIVELSEASLDLCRRRFDAYGLSASFYHGDAEELSTFVPIEPYDLIYSFGVNHNSPDPGRIIGEIRKYLVDRSELRLMLYSKWSWKVAWIVVGYGGGRFWRAAELIRRYSEAQEGCPVTHIHSIGEIRRLLHAFEIVELRKDHIFPYVIGEYVRYQYRRMWYFRWMPSRLFRWLERHLGWHVFAEAQLVDRQPQEVAIDPPHPLDAPVLRRAHNPVVASFLTPEAIGSWAPHSPG